MPCLLVLILPSTARKLEEGGLTRCWEPTELALHVERPTWLQPPVTQCLAPSKEERTAQSLMWTPSGAHRLCAIIYKAKHMKQEQCRCCSYKGRSSTHVLFYLKLCPRQLFLSDDSPLLRVLQNSLCVHSLTHLAPYPSGSGNQVLRIPLCPDFINIFKLAVT